MRLDQIAKRAGGPPARPASRDAAPRPRDGEDPLAQLARLIARDETFAPIVPNNDRPQRRDEFAVDRDERPASLRAREHIPFHQGRDGDEHSLLIPAGIAPGPSGEAHDPYDEGDCDEPDYSNGLPVQRPWLPVLAALGGLALLGSASALAYRAWFDQPVSREEARVVGTSTVPEKLLPPSQQQASRSDEQPGAGSSVGEEKPADAQPAASPALPPLSIPSDAAPTQVAALTFGPAPPDTAAAAQNQPPPSNEAAPNPTTLSATEPPVGNGPKYIVQLSSQRSEAAAQTTSRGLQTKYADLFGGLQPFIRRSDLRDKGVYYRVLVGPFAAFGEANQLCGSLKKSGGDCVVQKN